MSDKLIHNLEIMFVSAGLAAAALLMSKLPLKTRVIGFFAALLFASILGFVVDRTPIISDWDYLVAAIAALTGPATLIRLQGKTITEVIKEIKDAAEGGDNAKD